MPVELMIGIIVFILVLAVLRVTAKGEIPKPKVTKHTLSEKVTRSKDVYDLQKELEDYMKLLEKNRQDRINQYKRNDK